MHTGRGERFDGQVRNPVTELVLTRRSNTYPLAVKGMSYEEIGVATVTAMKEVWEL